MTKPSQLDAVTNRQLLAAYLGLMVGAARLCPPDKSVAGFVAAVVALSAGLVVICWWKGEPVRWRWG